MNPWNRGRGDEVRATSSSDSRGESYLGQSKLAEAEQAFVEEQAFGRALEMALVQADGEVDARARLVHLARAKRYAVAGTDVAGQREVALRYQRTRQALLEATPAGSTKRSELSEIGRSFEALDALDEAAKAFRLAEDRVSLARVLTAAGEVEALEEALQGQETAERVVRDLAETRGRAKHLAATGQREAAITLLRATVRIEPNAELSRLETSILEGCARVAGTTLIADNGPSELAVFGDEIVVGRGDAAHVSIASPVVSRRHLLVRRDARGQPQVLVEGRGTLLGGALVSGELSVNGHLELMLGAVRCTLDRSPTGGIVLETGGKRYNLPLGPLLVGPFVITPSGEGLRLASQQPGVYPHLDGVTACPEGIDLARGDRISAERGGPFVLQVER